MSDTKEVCGFCNTSGGLEVWLDYLGVQWHRCNYCGKKRTLVKFIKK